MIRLKKYIYTSLFQDRIVIHIKHATFSTNIYSYLAAFWGSGVRKMQVLLLKIAMNLLILSLLQHLIFV